MKLTLLLHVIVFYYFQHSRYSKFRPIIMDAFILCKNVYSIKFDPFTALDGVQKMSLGKYKSLWMSGRKTWCHVLICINFFMKTGDTTG